MKKDLTNYRKIYNKGELIESKLPENPMELFSQWFDEVENNGKIEEPNAMTVSSIGKDGYPKSRIVLLKKYNTEGFTFYTNYNSEKGKAILTNSKVCLSFFWPSLEQQVIIKGIATMESDKLSTAYFKSRPRGSQIGAWASNQSDKINSKEVLSNQVFKLEKHFENKEIPKPTHWGGFIIKPISIEFWQGRPNRLHDRILYTLASNKWNFSRLAP